MPVVGGVVLAMLVPASLAGAQGSPAGAVTQTIALGSPLPRFGPAPAAFAGGRVWVSTAKGLVRVNPRTGRVQGRPLKIGSESAFRLVADGRRLWVLASSTITRVDARRGVATGTIELPKGHFVQGFDVSGRTAWVLSVRPPTPRARVAAYDIRTLRRCTSCGRVAAAAVPAGAGSIDVRGRDIYISAFSFDGTGGSGLFGLRTNGPGRRFVGGALFPAVTAGGAWVTIGSSVAHVDLARFAYDGRATRVPGRQVDDPVVGLGSVWFTASTAIPRRNKPPSRRAPALYRVDPATGLPAGDPVALPAPPSAFGTTTGAGSVWIVTAKGLVRVRPTSPAPAPIVVVPSDPAPLVNGPLTAGRYASQPPFGVRLTLTLADDGWFSSTPPGAGGVFDPEALDIQRADSTSEDISVALPVAVYGRSGRVPATTVDATVAALTTNPGLRATNTAPTTLGGRPATGFDVRPKGPDVKVLAISTDTLGLAEGAPRAHIIVTSDPSGRVIVVLASRGPADPPVRSQALLDSLTFP